MKETISIIIPIYNTGIHLHKCISSILSQTFTSFELILINDGSTDNSGEICDEYAKKDNRIKVIHKENAGVSAARNDGIKMACGEYIGFVDSDDWIEIDMYEKMYSLAKDNDAEIVMCDATTVYDEKQSEPDTIHKLQSDILLRKENMYPALLLEMAGSAWRCIYKSSLIKDNNVLFPVGIKLSEDRIFNILAFGYSNSIYYTKTPFYNRYMRKGSAVHKYYDNKLQMALDAKRETEKALNLFGDEYKKVYLNQFITSCFTAICDTFSKSSPLSLSGRYKEIKRICNDVTLQNALSILKPNSFKLKPVAKKQILLLCVLAILTNLKNRS